MIWDISDILFLFTASYCSGDTEQVTGPEQWPMTQWRTQIVESDRDPYIWIVGNCNTQIAQSFFEQQTIFHNPRVNVRMPEYLTYLVKPWGIKIVT